MRTRTREAGYIFTEVKAKKYFECRVCPDPILPGETYLQVEKGGGGLSWAVHPDRIHNTASDKELYLEKWSF
jgi:hypothetical protein|tara:strand:- start:1448 stop:1663 length:216 start_codon:yes stop_codon:yes gene_type:complete